MSGLSAEGLRDLGHVAAYPSVPALRADAERTAGRRWITVEELDAREAEPFAAAERLARRIAGLAPLPCADDD